jgi:hypothetical protein
MAAVGDYDAEHEALIDRLREQLAAKLDPERDLWDCCPAGRDCWRHREKPPSPHRFRVPYVGPS